MKKNLFYLILPLFLISNCSWSPLSINKRELSSKIITNCNDLMNIFWSFETREQDLANIYYKMASNRTYNTDQLNYLLHTIDKQKLIAPNKRSLEDSILEGTEDIKSESLGYVRTFFHKIIEKSQDKATFLKGPLKKIDAAILKSQNKETTDTLDVFTELSLEELILLKQKIASNGKEKLTHREMEWIKRSIQETIIDRKLFTLKINNNINFPIGDLKEFFTKLLLDIDEYEHIFKFLKSRSFKPSEIQRLQTYILFVRKLNKKHRVTAYQTFSELLAEGTDTNSKTLKTFYKFENYLQLKKQHEAEKIIKNINANGFDQYNEELKSFGIQATSDKNKTEQLADQLAKARVLKKETHRLKCRAQISSPELEMAKSRFTKFFLSISTISTAGTYWFTSNDQEKDKDWYKGLIYEMAFTLGISGIYSKIITNENAAYIKKYFQSYGTGLGAGLADGLLYPLLFRDDSSALNERIDQILNDKDYKEKTKELLKQLENEASIPKLKRNLKELVTIFNPSDLDKSYKMLSEDLEGENISDEEIKTRYNDLLLYLATLEIYQENKGVFSVGDPGMDRLGHFALFDIAGTSFDLYIASLIFYTLCNDIDRPLMGAAKALSLFTFGAVTYKSLFYFTRNKAITNEEE